MLVQIELELTDIMTLKGSILTELKKLQKDLKKIEDARLKELIRIKEHRLITLFNKLAKTAQDIIDAQH